MFCLRLLQIVLLVLVESYICLRISYYQYSLSCSTSQAETFGRWLFPAVMFFMLFSVIALILPWLANGLQITSTAFLLSSISCSFASLVGFVRQERSTLFMQWSLQVLFLQ